MTNTTLRSFLVLITHANDEQRSDCLVNFSVSPSIKQGGSYVFIIRGWIFPMASRNISKAGDPKDMNLVINSSAGDEEREPQVKKWLRKLEMQRFSATCSHKGWIMGSLLLPTGNAAWGLHKTDVWRAWGFLFLIFASYSGCMYWNRIKTHGCENTHSYILSDVPVFVEKYWVLKYFRGWQIGWMPSVWEMIINISPWVTLV